MPWLEPVSRSARRLLIGLVWAALLTSPVWAGTPESPGDDVAVTLGDGVAVQETTSMEALLADPDAFIGKTVRVEGKVVDVCPRKGCWVEINDADQSLRIKVQDDVIVFPADSVGRVLVAEGVVEAIEQTRQQHLDWLAHLAEERGESFDPEAADIGDGPYRWIQIQGTGAELAAAP